MKVGRKISSFLLYKLWGWKVEVSFAPRDKCILCVAPHTSNIDFFVAHLYYASLGRKAAFLMKKEWFVWPLSSIFYQMGGIPVDRSQHGNLTDYLAEKAKCGDRFELAITPEGTRSLCHQWKRGFYYIALKAGIPIQLYGLDYANKRIVGNMELMPTGDVDADMLKIQTYFKDFKGRHPERFSAGV